MTTAPTGTTTGIPAPPPARAARTRPPLRRRSGSGSGFLFVLPFLVVYAVFLVWPLLLGIWYSFANQDITGGEAEPVGLDNYAEALGDAAMWSSLWHTVVFTVGSTVPLVLLGLVMALLAHALAPARWLWRLAFFAPYVLPSSVVALIWIWIYQPGFGLFDQVLAGVGLDGPGWLTDPDVAMWSLVLTTVWWTVGFNFLLYLAALQAIPAHLYEAAALDGASAWQRLRHVTLPMLRPTTALVVVLQVLASLKVFDQMYLMTGGGPDQSTRSLIQYVYEAGFTGYRIGYASAVSYVFFALLLLVSLAQLWLTRSRKEAAS